MMRAGWAPSPPAQQSADDGLAGERFVGKVLTTVPDCRVSKAAIFAKALLSARQVEHISPD
jgi:hypothetical protein